MVLFGTILGDASFFYITSSAVIIGGFLANHRLFYGLKCTRSRLRSLLLDVIGVEIKHLQKNLMAFDVCLSFNFCPFLNEKLSVLVAKRRQTLSAVGINAAELAQYH